MSERTRPFKVMVRDNSRGNWRTNPGEYFYSSHLPVQKDGNGVVNDSEVARVSKLVWTHPDRLWDCDGGYWTVATKDFFYQVWIDAETYGYV